MIAFFQDLKAKDNSKEGNFREIRLDSAKSESAAKEKLLENENKSENDGDASETKNLASDEVKNQSEEIAKAISYKVVNFLRFNRNSVSKKPEEMKNENLKESINLTNAEDLEKKENESDTSIANLLKDENFYYKQENSVEINNNSITTNNAKKKKRNMIASLTSGLNSIKYRLKKNYFSHKET